MPASKPECASRARTGRFLLLSLLSVLLAGSALRAQLTADQAADALLTSARKAYNDQNYPLAAAQFRDFLAKYGKHKDVPAARYGLALSLVDGPSKDYAVAAEQLKGLAGIVNFPQRPFVLYYLGRARRGLGIKELALARPQDLAQRRAAANQHFSAADKLFADAAPAFTARVKAPDPRAKELPLDLEWAARARCDQSEMLLRLVKAKEARAAAEVFLKDALLVRSRYRGLGLYYHGFACFLLKDYNAAGRSLNTLTPFASSVYATHARYLLARVHHLQDERAEAGRHYEGVLADYARFKQQAAEALRQPDRLKNDPGEKARLEALVKEAAPEHVARAAFFSGTLLYEGGKFAEALARFASFPQQHPASALRVEAQLRSGLCQVRLGQFAEAVKTLQPIADREPYLADQALLWISKAQLGAADPGNAPAYAQALKTATDTLRKAADKARSLVKADPEAGPRQGEILLALADTQLRARQFKEAAATYGSIRNEKLLPRRGEEVLQRQLTAHHLAGDHAASDRLCALFRKDHPQSPLLPAVLFRHAENAYFIALAAEKDPKLPDRANTLAKLAAEAVKRYREVIDRFPEYPYANRARYGLALLLYHKEDLEQARKVLETIPQAERHGDLALTPYLLADCLVRLAPATANTLPAGKLQEQLQAAALLLDSFVGAEPNGPHTPAALIKLGLCHQRLAALMVKPEDRQKGLTSARAAYEKIINQFAAHPLRPQAVFERAKCLAQAGDRQGAINECRRFTSDAALKAAPVAPLAVLQMAVLLREQNQAGEAARVLADCRKQHEPALLKDVARVGWVVLLQYHHGLALREARQLAAARGVFDGLIKQFPNRPEAARAALRRGQCLKEEARTRIEAARKKLAAANLKPPELAAARTELSAGQKALGEAADYLADQARHLKTKQPARKVRARMLYEAAWGYRELAGPESAPALQEKARKLQPSEEKARAQYQALIEDFAGLPLVNDARLELAELYAERDEYGPAVILLEEALGKKPPAELTEKIRLRLGTCYAAKKDFKSALVQFDALAGNPKSPWLGQAHYRAGECLLALQDHARAAARLAVFRDQGPFQNLPGLTDHALLRLGHAYEGFQQWQQSRQAHELLVGRFGSSPWVHEARYGIGWSWQNLKQHDAAVNFYMQVTSATCTEVAARAQYQIGMCRLEQNRYGEAAAAFLVVPFTYDYPEWSAAALCQAARAFALDKKPQEAEKCLRRVIRDYPKSKWADDARKRLGR